MVKVLITGGAGFIGLHLAERMLKDGHRVVICDNFSRAVKDPEFLQLADHRHCEMIEVDLLDENSVYSLGVDFDLIFHLAAIIGVQHVLAQPYEVLTKNVVILQNVISLADSQKNLSRFLFASTSEIYSGTQQQFDLTLPTPEDTPLAVGNLHHPRTSYMLSKLYGEAMCLQSRLPFTIFRPHNIYGPRMGLSHVIPELCKKIYHCKISQELEVYSVKHTRTFCYVSDAIEQLVRMSDLPKCEGKVLNLGTSSPETTIGDLALTILRIANRKDLSIKQMPATSGSPERRCPDMTITSELINFSSEVSLIDGIQQTFNWYSERVFKAGGISSK